MQYIKRSLERKFLRMNGFFKAILVTVPGRWGKLPCSGSWQQGKNVLM